MVRTKARNLVVSTVTELDVKMTSLFRMANDWKGLAGNRPAVRMLAKNGDDVWGQLDQRVGKGGRLAAFLGPLDVSAQGAATGRDDASGAES
jgi:hypothetical protein